MELKCNSVMLVILIIICVYYIAYYICVYFNPLNQKLIYFLRFLKPYKSILFVVLNYYVAVLTSFQLKFLTLALKCQTI